MKVTLTDGPFRGEIEHPGLRPGTCLQLVVTGNPDLYGKADQHVTVRGCAYEVGEDGEARECKRPTE